MPIAPLPGPHGLYNVSVMPRFLLDSSRVGWQGVYFTDIHPAAEGCVDHGHERYCVHRCTNGVSLRTLGSAAWREYAAGCSVWRPGDEQRSLWRGSGRSQFLFLAPHQVESVLGHTRALPALGQVQPSRSRMLELVFDALQADLAHGSPAGPLVGESLVAALVAHLAAPDAAPTGRVAAPACGRAIDLIEARFAEPLTLEELARTAGVGVRQFSRAFAHATGQTPHRYLLQRRVEHARLLIAQGLALAEVALQCGFADQSQLTRTFVRELGTTPGRYRDRLRG